MMSKNSIIVQNKIDKQRQKWINHFDIMTDEIIQKEICSMNQNAAAKT
jgi:hypothetical protein